MGRFSPQLYLLQASSCLHGDVFSSIVIIIIIAVAMTMAVVSHCYAQLVQIEI